MRWIVFLLVLVVSCSVPFKGDPVFLDDEGFVNNSAPVISVSKQLIVREGDFVNIIPQVTDSDGDLVVVSYSGWMHNSTYRTSFSDAGRHFVKIVADDGFSSVESEIEILVLDSNRAPEFIVVG